jgi:tRNA A-37 threonylcarbamoyl transferase component Bud32
MNVRQFLQLDLPFYESVNHRRGGWSGVSRISCAGTTYYIKRQQAHSYREPRRGFLRTPTLRREYRNMLRLKSIRVRTPEITRFAAQGEDGYMITRELKGYINLEEYLRCMPVAGRANLMRSIAATLLRMHRAYLHHGCLYGKHVMISTTLPLRVALLDMEKLRMTIRRSHSAAKDIGQLVRHTEGLQPQDEQVICNYYASVFSDFPKLLSAQLGLGKYSVHDQSDKLAPD